jgi:NAD(P)-dependent dehydrogenase (short-subunit alcohol dehydrogenase family)
MEAGITEATPPEQGVVWITGAARGLGKSIALHLAQQGWRVGMIDVDEPALRTAEREVSSVGSCVGVPCDVSSSEQIAAAASVFETSLGPVTALINNAVAAEHASILILDEAVWRRSLDVSLTGYFLIAQTAARKMVERRAGSIVNISSGSAERGMPGTAAYACSKGGVNTLTRVLCTDLAEFGIRANTVTVGPMDTEFFRDFLHNDAEGIEARRARVPLGRLGVPEDVHGVIDYLLSPGSMWTTGALFNIDGGANNAGFVKLVPA